MSDLELSGSITLVTALPGSGKTLRLCELIDGFSKEGVPVYVTNVPGLKLPHIPWRDPTAWRDLPSGSVLVVDECQDFFPALRGDPPDYVREMSRIRHYSVRLVLATQRPEYVHSYLRRLCGPHEHLIRINGKEASQVWRSNRLIPDVDNNNALKRLDFHEWPFPKDFYGAYESAEVHTVKRVVNRNARRKVIVYCIAAVLFTGVFGGLYAGFKYFMPSRSGEPATEGGTASRRSLVDAAARLTQSNQPSYATAAEYLKAHQPLVAAIPGSAPVFSGREPVSHPALYCMSSDGGTNGLGKYQPASCTCLTEQGTSYSIEPEQCRYIALNGTPYDPYKVPLDGVKRVAGVEPGREVGDVSPASGVIDSQASPGALIAASQGVGNGRVTVSDAKVIGGVN